MKKRIISFLAAVCVVLGVLTPTASFAAEASIFFVSVNDTVPLTLTSAAAPYTSGDTLYVPYTVFGVSGVGVTPSYNADNGTLTLFSRSKRLVFDLRAGGVTDESGTRGAVSAVSHSGTVFLPASYAAEHFDFSCSLLTSLGGYHVVRFTNGSQVYDDKLFVQKAENLIAYRVQQYLQEQESAMPPATTKPSAPATTTKPSTSTKPASPTTTSPPATTNPSTTKPTTPANQPQKKPATVYLAITGADSMAESLAALRRQNIRAVFYLTAEEIEADPELVRSIRAAGYPVGLTASADETDVSAALTKANEALDGVTQEKTLMALLTTAQASSTGGYFAVTRGKAVTTAAAAAMEERSCLVICDKSCGGTLATLTAKGVTFRLIRETTSF